MKLFVYVGIFSRRDSWTESDTSIKGSYHWWERGVHEGSIGELSAPYSSWPGPSGPPICGICQPLRSWQAKGGQCEGWGKWLCEIEFSWALLSMHNELCLSIHLLALWPPDSFLPYRKEFWTCTSPSMITDFKTMGLETMENWMVPLAPVQPQHSPLPIHISETESSSSHNSQVGTPGPSRAVTCPASHQYPPRLTDEDHWV